MKTKEAIRFCDTFEKCSVFEYTVTLSKKDGIAFTNIIKILKRGEKYEQIVKDIVYDLDWHKPECPFSTPDGELIDEILEMIDNIKQKYFPKEANHDYPEGEE